MTDLNTLRPRKDIRQSGVGNPTVSTVARIGERYQNTTSLEIFTCIQSSGIPTKATVYTGATIISESACSYLACPATNVKGSIGVTIWEQSTGYTWQIGYYQTGSVTNVIPDGYSGAVQGACISCGPDSDFEYFPIVIRSNATSVSPPYVPQEIALVETNWIGTQGTLVTATPAILATDHPNLVAMYTMDNISGATLVDESSNTNDGTITGAVAVAGKIGNALNFDAPAEVVHVYSSALNMSTSDWAVSGWIKTSDTTKNKSVIQKRGQPGDGSTTEGWFVQVNTAGYLTGFIDPVTAQGSPVEIASLTTVNTGVWTHFAVVWDRSGSLYIYLGGALDNSGSIAALDGVTISTADSAAIGNNSSPGLATSVTDFIGDIDQLRIFNRVLTQPEITALHNEGSP
ncbi:LamG domain-containing protein [bacterium]|nr:LamG domain-containing protein [bacterium]